MEDLYILLNNISKITWLFYVLSFLGFYYVAKGFSDKSSDLIASLIIVVLNALMLGYQGVLDWYMQANPIVSSYVNFFWYMGFASFDLVALIVIFKIHKKENVRIGQLGQYASLAFFTAGSIQLLQYAEIVIFRSDQYIDRIYSIGIPTVNIALAVICFIAATKAVFNAHTQKEQQKG